jgi:uncharacterized protein (TIGR02246 family)
MRKSRISLVAATAVVLLSAGYCEPAGLSEADVNAINDVREAEMASISAGDVDAHLAVMTDDCLVMPPGGEAVVGHEAVRAWSEAFIEMFEIAGEYTGSEVVGAGDWAIENYTATLTLTPRAGGEAAMETIKGIHVYRRQADGSWKIAQDVWNSDAAPM